MTDKATIIIDKRTAGKLRQGYPWIFKSEIKNLGGLEEISNGQIVEIINGAGDFVARGFCNPKAQLCARVLTLHSPEEIDAHFVFKRIENAFNSRSRLYTEPYYRLIHAESDYMPGLIIDRYGDVIICQVNTAGMDNLWPFIEDALNKIIAPKAIILKNDTPSRTSEGLESYVKVIGTLEKQELEIIENNTKFIVDALDGQKTGWFFDQRDNRAWLASLSKDRGFIDIFCHTGGIGITAAKLGGAKQVTFVDSSAPAIEITKKNAELNGVADKCHYIVGKAFEVMEDLANQEKVYGVVSVDPPAFIKSRKDMVSGMKGYQKLAKLAVPLVRKGGILFFASCSHHAETSELLANISESIAHSGRPFQLIKTSGAAPDHPVHPVLPETSYLKGFTFKFLD